MGLFKNNEPAATTDDKIQKDPFKDNSAALSKWSKDFTAACDEKDVQAGVQNPNFQKGVANDREARKL